MLFPIRHVISDTSRYFRYVTLFPIRQLRIFPSPRRASNPQRSELRGETLLPGCYYFRKYKKALRRNIFSVSLTKDRCSKRIL